MRLLPVLFAFAGAAMMASPAAAHWQYTRWGMTPGQVVNASHGDAHLSHGDEGQSTLEGSLEVEGTYRSADYSFRTQLYFARGERLTAVRLSPDDPTACASLGADLRARYGSPVESRPIGSIHATHWIDAASGNDVRFTELSGECFAFYSAIVRPETGGL